MEGRNILNNFGVEYIFILCVTINRRNSYLFGIRSSKIYFIVVLAYFVYKIMKNY